MSNNKIQTVLGFDFGIKKMGVAVGQVITKTASPLTILKMKSGEPNWQEIAALVARWRPDALVVGMPYGLAEHNAYVLEQAKAFSLALAAQTQLPVYEVDETLSSRAAHDCLNENTMTRRKHTQEIDDIAATLIVETWLQEGVL